MPMQRPLILLLLTLSVMSAPSCARQFSVSVNNRTLYDPRDNLPPVTLVDPVLQACVNLALDQPDLTTANDLLALSCANTGVSDLRGIEHLTGLRFLDLAGNQVSDLSPLSILPRLSGLNLPDNRITDIAPLLSIPTLSAVVLSGNSQIPCAQLAVLQQRLGSSLTAPNSCRN